MVPRRSCTRPWPPMAQPIRWRRVTRMAVGPLEGNLSELVAKRPNIDSTWSGHPSSRTSRRVWKPQGPKGLRKMQGGGRDWHPVCTEGFRSARTENFEVLFTQVNHRDAMQGLGPGHHVQCSDLVLIRAVTSFQAHPHLRHTRQALLELCVVSVGWNSDGPPGCELPG